MLYRKHIFTPLLICGLLLKECASVCQASPDSIAATTNGPALSASLRGGETVGKYQVQRAFLTIGTNSLVFIVPTGFHMDASATDRVVLSDNTGDYFITVRVTEAVPPGTEPQALFQNRALTRFPSGRISGESAASAAGHSGSKFDLAWANSNGIEQSARIAFIPSPAGILEFSVLTRTVNFGDAQRFLTVVMASVLSNETGKLVIRPLPDYS